MKTDDNKYINMLDAMNKYPKKYKNIINKTPTTIETNNERNIALSLFLIDTVLNKSVLIFPITAVRIAFKIKIE